MVLSLHIRQHLIILRGRPHLVLKHFTMMKQLDISRNTDLMFLNQNLWLQIPTRMTIVLQKGNVGTLRYHSFINGLSCNGTFNLPPLKIQEWNPLHLGYWYDPLKLQGCNNIEEQEEDQFRIDLSMNKFDWDHPAHLQLTIPSAIKQVSVVWDAYEETKDAHGICVVQEWDEFKVLENL